MISVRVNGVAHDVDVEADTPLLWVLRENLAMTGTKFGCGQAMCGACTVHVDGKATRSCVYPISAVGQAEVTTIEGVGTTPVGAAVQAAWRTVCVPQCGYCQSGQIMAACAFVASNPTPTDDDIGKGVTNLCRCGTFDRIRQAIKSAAAAVPPPQPPAEETPK